MLTRVDRLQVTASDRRDVAECYERLLDAEVVREDRIQVLAARRTVLRLGTSEIEVLEPDGVGRVADFMGRFGEGLFAAGFASRDPGALAEHLRRQGRPLVEEGEQLFLSPAGLGLPGLHAVVSPEQERERVGLLRGLYEVTSLVADAAAAALRIARVFGLDSSRFTPIHSDQYGYAGVLTLFHSDALDRIEVITPFDEGKTMGRYFRRKGPRLYMAYAETDDLVAVRQRLAARAAGHWSGAADEADNLFVHPAALHGVMLGISRTSHAWTWSGQPERVVPRSA